MEETTRKRGRPGGRQAPAYTALRNLKSLSEIDEKAAGLDEAMLRDITVKVNFNVDGKYSNIDELTLHQALKSGGIENYLRQIYGCGEFEVQVRGETTGGKKGIIVSPKYEILGDPTPKLLRLLSNLQRIRDGFTPNRLSSYQNPQLSFPDSQQTPTQLNAWNPEPNRELVQRLEAKIGVMERKAEQNEIIGAFQAENDEIKKQLAGLAQSIEKQSERKPDSSAWKEFIPVAASGLGGLVGILKDIITDRPSSTDMLKSSALMVRGISDFMSTLKDLNPQPPPPPTSDQTGSGLDAILKAAAPKLIAALSNRAVAPSGTQQPSRPTSEAMPLAQDVSQSRQNGNFPRTQEKLNELSALISQRISADAVADALVEICGVATEENALGMFPELVRLESDPQSALESFLSRFSLEGVEGQTYRRKIMDSIYRKFSGQAAPVDSSVSVEV